MEGVCPTQVQAQNKHSQKTQGLKDRPHLQAAFADIIAKDKPVYSI
jgi:hypothetical protein